MPAEGTSSSLSLVEELSKDGSESAGMYISLLFAFSI